MLGSGKETTLNLGLLGLRTYLPKVRWQEEAGAAGATLVIVRSQEDVPGLEEMPVGGRQEWTGPGPHHEQGSHGSLQVSEQPPCVTGHSGEHWKGKAQQCTRVERERVTRHSDDNEGRKLQAISIIPNRGGTPFLTSANHVVVCFFRCQYVVTICIDICVSMSIRKVGRRKYNQSRYIQHFNKCKSN